MQKLSLLIISVNIINWGWQDAPSAVAEPVVKPTCITEKDAGLIEKKTLPIVRSTADFKRLNGENVVLLGRYQLDGLTNVNRRSIVDLSQSEAATEAQKSRPDIISTYGFVNIVLADGLIVPVTPMGRQALREQSEIREYQDKQIRVEGTIQWGISNRNSLAKIDNITNLGVICNVPKSRSANSINSNANQIAVDQLAIVKTKADLVKFRGQSVQIIGKYIAESWQPGINSNTAGFKGTYTRVNIELADGTLIPLLQPYHKLSLRSPAEVKIYAGKIVKIIGSIQLEPDKPSPQKSPQRIMLTAVERISLESEK
jgi:hypothetical protein